MTDFGSRLKRARKLKNMTQRELAERLGVEQSAISNYETNFRLPAATALMEIANHLEVSVAYLLGGLADIEAFEVMATADTASKEIDLNEVQTEFLKDLLQNQLTVAFERIRSLSYDGIGLLDLYKHVFEPTLKAVGYLWETGKISIADEHIISDLIERAVISLSENVQRDNQPSKNLTAAFMLPGAEMHELPLKMTAELFKSAGWSVNYIGKSIPIFSVQQFLEKNKIDVFVLSITLKAHLTSCESLIHLINGMQLSNPPLILIGGSAIENEKVALQTLGGDMYLESLDALKDLLEPLGETLFNLKNT